MVDRRQAVLIRLGCLELLAAIEHFDATATGSICCGLPVSIDGSCSGYQHYSAAMRAEKEASLVNLMPSDEPQDIYQFIADSDGTSRPTPML